MTRRPTRPAPLVAALALALAAPCSPAAAQTVLVRVAGEESGMPLFGALAYLVDASGETVRNALTDERGRSLFVGIPVATYRVRVEMIGMATAETDPFEVGDGMSVSKELRLASSAIQLEGIEVEAGGRCSVRPGGEGLVVADVWDEARKALAAAALTDDQGIYRYETTRYTRELDRGFAILSEEESTRDAYMRTPFESLPAEELVYGGFVQPDGTAYLYYAPDAGVLLSDPFLDTHCFRLERGPEGLIGLAFEPTGENRNVPDIAGTMWLDEQTAELQWLEYRYEYLDADLRSDAVGGRVDFRRMPSGTWIVPEWWIRMPRLTEQVDRDGRRRRFVNGYRQTGGVVAEVREAGGRRLGQRVETGGFEGVVVDSVGVPLPGVRVGVVGSNQEVFTNAEGRYGITGLSPGRYQVRFVDPSLELLGFVDTPVTRDVIRGELTTLDQHMPSMGDVLFERCRDIPTPEGTVILGGMVRDGRQRPISGASVIVEWETYSVSGVDTADLSVDAIRTNGYDTTTDDRGFYLFCGVPTDQRLQLRGESGELTSPVYEFSVGIDRFAVIRPIELGS